jgi:Na+/melibiose symporter-like transporter
VIGRPFLLAIHMLVVGACGVLGAFSSRFILKKIHVRTACLIVYPIISILLFSTRFFAYIPAAFIAVNGIMQFFASTTQPMESNLYMDAVVYSEWKTGISAKAFIMSMYQIPIKLSKVVKNLIISAILVSIGYKAGATTEAIKQGIINGYSVVPAILPLVGWISMFFFYKLTPEKMKMMRKEIEARKMKNSNT